MDNPEVFTECTYGSGSFGKWIVDEYGLPAYEYTLNQNSDKRALWWNSAKKERREHLHQLGNFRLTATAYNDGYVQLFSEENGFKWFNYFDESQKNYSGGFSYIYDGEKVWSTAHRFRPEGAKARRIFGLGYFETQMDYRNILVIRKVFAPYGDDPVLLSETEIKNKSGEPLELTHYEYWDVNLHHMVMMLLSSGVLDPSIPEKNIEQRKAFNRFFKQDAIFDENFNAGLIKTTPKYPEASELNIPPPGFATDLDYSPPFVFLAPLDEKSAGDFIFDQNEFFGGGDGSNPENAGTDFIPSVPLEQPGTAQQFALIHKRRMSIEPAESKKIRYAFGYTESETALRFLDAYRDVSEDYLKTTLDSWRENLALFAPESDPFLHREIAWHSYYLQSASYYRDYTKTHIVSQGGEYLFGHGFDGATRDYCIFSVPLIYLNPQLAKEILKFIMMTTTLEGQMAYGNFGDVSITGAVILSQPSDLDIFFFWALSEYILATRDFEFLNETVPFYRSDGMYINPTATVLDHVRTAFDHLVNTVGVGEHGLIRLRTGDWSDGITWFTENPSVAEKDGESAFNTAFAAAVLPKIAEAIENIDATLASKMRESALAYADAMKNQWVGKWYLRGWQGNGKPFGVDNLFLEPQAWALIAGIPDAEKTEILLDSIYTILDSNSPLGARIVFPPKEDMFGGLLPGTDVNGGIWHAINSILAWAYSLYRPDYAWDSFKKNTLASHAEAYSDLWYGIWSGPDSYNAPESERPGEAASHYATALTDFPVMNMNQHANPLIALIKLAGIYPERDGVRISPKIPLKNWTLNLPLLGIRYSPERISGYYNGIKDGSIKLTLPVPEKSDPARLTVMVNGNPVSYEISGNSVTFVLEFIKKQRMSWEVT